MFFFSLLLKEKRKTISTEAQLKNSQITKKSKPLTDTGHFTPLTIMSEMAFLSNSRLQTRKERPNQSTNRYC